MYLANGTEQTKKMSKAHPRISPFLPTISGPVAQPGQSGRAILDGSRMTSSFAVLLSRGSLVQIQPGPTFFSRMPELTFTRVIHVVIERYDRHCWNDERIFYTPVGWPKKQFTPIIMAYRSPLGRRLDEC